MMLREVGIGWEWEVYIEMFVAGIAAGAFLIAMILELYGRGRSPIARTAHIISLPLILLATVLLIYKLERSERFWHMVIQSENIPWPMLKWWSPISFGSWLLMGFGAVATISFIDALIDRGWFGISRWRADDLTVHGSVVGKILAVMGIIFALLVAAYSGMLLSVTAVPGWQDTIFIAPFFVGVSAATGAAALLLVETIRRLAPLDEVDSLSQFGTIAVGWQLLMLVALAISLGGAASFFLSSLRAISAFVIAVISGLVAMALLYFRIYRSDQVRLGAGAALVLLSGFLFRYAVVMGPQHEIE